MTEGNQVVCARLHSPWRACRRQKYTLSMRTESFYAPVRYTWRVISNTALAAASFRLTTAQEIIIRYDHWQALFRAFRLPPWAIQRPVLVPEAGSHSTSHGFFRALSRNSPGPMTLNSQKMTRASMPSTALQLSERCDNLSRGKGRRTVPL